MLPEPENNTASPTYLTLAECREYDPKPSASGHYLRFRCPLHGGDNQQSLRIDLEKGTFHCFNCGAWGSLAGTWWEHSQNNKASTVTWGQDAKALAEPTPMEPNKPAVVCMWQAHQEFHGSLAEEYARKRGVPKRLMDPLKLGYCHRRFRDIDSEWLTFPTYCPVSGAPIGLYARNLHSDEQSKKAHVWGPKGVFGAFEFNQPMPSDVIVVEGVFEVIAILKSKMPQEARAVIGTSAQPEWFDPCERVTILLDDDEAGRGSAQRLAQRLAKRHETRGEGPQVLQMRAESLQKRHGCKDLGEMLQKGILVKLNLPPLMGSGE